MARASFSPSRQRSLTPDRVARYLIWCVVVLAHNALHEIIHYAAAGLSGESVAELRLFTNGWGTSRVLYVTPVAARTGLKWLVIGWAPAVATTFIGYIAYLFRMRLTAGGGPLRNLSVWYLALAFLTIDPLYFSVISLLIEGGGDVGAAAAVGWSVWPVRVVAGLVLWFNFRLLKRWYHELKTASETAVNKADGQ